MGLLGTIASDVGDITTAFRVLDDTVGDLLLQGTATLKTLKNIQATSTGLLADIRTVRGTLDATDVRDEVLAERGDSIINVHRFGRRTRFTMSPLENSLRVIAELARKLEQGFIQRTHVVRSGETWQAIAQRHLGDFREWPRIADANGLDAQDLVAGLVLVIPDRR